jgi:fructokinase
MGQIIQTKTRIPTTLPHETLDQVIAFFRGQTNENDKPLAAIGIGCFGPLDLEKSSNGYGSITSTSKPGWMNTPVYQMLRSALDIPVVIDTDVNAAAIGEHTWVQPKG